MPSTAERTSTAQSSTRRDRSTSAEKSTCPGVSIRLILTPSHSNDSADARTEIPRRLSTSSASERLVPLSTFPGERMAPLRNSIFSVTVVLPASTCARIPRLRILEESSGGTGLSFNRSVAERHTGDVRGYTPHDKQKPSRQRGGNGTKKDQNVKGEVLPVSARNAVPCGNCPLPLPVSGFFPVILASIHAFS